MTLEMIPLILGGLLGLLGLLLVFDAWAPDHIVVSEERRRRPRRARDCFGEAMVGLGVIAVAAALIGRDTWRYTTVAAIAAAVLLLFGSMRNARFIKDVFTRGDRPKLAPGSRRVR